MELVKLVATRSRWSEATHVVFNVLFALALFLLVNPSVDLPYLAYIFVVLSKWRVIAVRPRFWFANFQANLVDFMVGISAVTLMLMTAISAPYVSFAIAVLFAIWLIVLKPHSAKRWVLLQAGVAQFIALVALFSYAHGFELKPLVTDSSLLTVLLAWVVGYSAARHALSAFRDEDERTLLSIVWGFVVAELAWLAHHWTIAYLIYRGTSVEGQLMLPQIAIIITLLGLAVIKWYEVFHHSQEKKEVIDARNATIFSAIVIVFMLVFANGWDITAL